jgi:UDP-glucose 4-epimerase
MADRILITGGAGFIGSHLAHSCLADGAHVVVLDSLRTGHRRNLAGLDVEFVEGSVEDAALLRRLAAGCRHIYHLAALVSVPESMEKPLETERINTVGTLNVLDAARHAGCERVVLSSTSAVYGMADRPIHREDDLPEPASPYAISKLAAEHYARLYNDAFATPAVALRYFNVYGPRQDPDSPYAAAMAIFTARARAGQPLRIYGDGGQTRDFIHVHDVVRANRLVATAPGVAGVYNVATGHPITINDLAQSIIAATRSTSPIEYTSPRAGDVRHSRGDATRLRALGWQPQIPLDEGIRLTLQAAEE